MVEGSVNGKAAATTQPRHTNSGVSMSLGVDWSSWSRPGSIKDFRDILLEVCARFKTVFESRPGKHGYRGCDLAGYGSCLTRGSDILVNLPGQAMSYCRWYLKISDQELLRWFLERGFKATRIDCSLDTSEKAFNPRRAFDWWRRGLVNCNAQKWTYRLDEVRPGRGILPPNGEGMTVYAGSRKSLRQVRIYDKKTEALKKTGELVTDNNGNELDHLTRIEMQLRKEAAQLGAHTIADKGIDCIRELIAGHMEFLSEYDSRKKRRKNPAQWWLRIVGGQKTCLTLPPVISTPDQAIHWIEKQVIQTLKLLRGKAPDVWERLLNKKMPDYEVNALKEKLWDAWAKVRADRKADLEEMKLSEECDRVLAELLRQSSATGRTVGDHE